MTEHTPPSGGNSKLQPENLAGALKRHLACLQNSDLADSPETDRKTAEALAILIDLFKKIEQTLVSQLEVLGKNHPRIKDMGETLKNQNLLNVENALQAVLSSKATRMTRLNNYADLLMRWWSAVLAGVQSTVLEVPHELTEALNPANWELEKKRWSSEEAAFWEHYRHVIRHDTPLKVGDKMKTMQAEKTLDTYAILGGEKTAPRHEE